MRDQALPDIETIIQGLHSVLGPAACREDITITAREPHIYASTFPSEIITCHLDEGPELKLYCKYSADIDNNSYRHRGGVSYEAAVYRYLLDPLGINVPAYYGCYEDPASGWSCLILEYLDNILWVSRTTSPESMLANAAGWIGHFHAACEERRRDPELSFLMNYDCEYYTGWAERTLEFAHASDVRIAWLETLWHRFDEIVEIFVDCRQTILHGEFCPHNIVVHNYDIYPVDWESAAKGPGEIDLIALTEGWPADVHEACKKAYYSARWPDGPPSDVTRILHAARIYWNLRWLGESRRSFERKSARVHLSEIHDASKRLGII